MTPLEFVRTWHEAAKLACPRFFPDGWLRQAAALMEKGITVEDLRLVADWMLRQQRRAMEREPGAVPFNAGSFAWRKMFGEFGASDQHEVFLERLAAAEAACGKPAGKPVGNASARPVQTAGNEDEIRAQARAAAAKLRAQLGGR